MTIQLSDEECEALRHALRHYVSELREEIRKTGKHDWRTKLHAEQDALKRAIERLDEVAAVPA